MRAAAPEVSVVIVNWNHVDELVPCLRSLYDGGADELQVIVVDNGSRDTSVATTRREFPAVEVITTGANLGFAEGCNRGIAAARAPWVFTLNNDASLIGDGLSRLRRLVREAPPDVGTLQPTLLFKDRPHHINSAGIVIHRDGFGSDRGFGTLDRHERGPRDVFACTAGAALYRRAMLDQVALASGVFDRTFFMYFEDVDLGWRCRLAGWRAMHHPEARVAHRFQGSSHRHGSRWLMRLIYTNWLRTLVKNASPRLLTCATRTLARLLARDLVRDRGGLPRYLPAAREALAQRAEVGRLVTVPREAVEARWLGRW